MTCLPISRPLLTEHFLSREPMRKSSNIQKEILVNAGFLESRVAILEEGRLAELHLEREPRIVGNIYKARVNTVLRGMEAAFVDIGLERHAFLSADDAVYSTQEEGESESIALPPAERRPLGGIAANQEILVQVNRAEVGTKGARVSTRLALPGRYLVLLLTDPGRVGISRKIESEKTRQRLRQLGEELCPRDCGLILRTEAEAARRPQLKQDLDFLLELKRRLLEKAANTPPPALLHQDLTLVFQIIRDYFTRDVQRLLVDSEEVYKSALELVEMIAPRLKKQVMLYRDETPIFERFGIEDEIARLRQRKVWLKAGGYISIDQTEALCAVDINTARFTGKAREGLAQTILRTNLEAADEIARQLRLRDIGGLIVLDFIDMKSYAHRAKVLKAFQEALARDRAKTRVLSISPLGIVEMTRKKHGESLLEKVSDTCPECGGLGRVPNAATICLQIQRELRQKAKERPAAALAVWASPEVAYLLIGSGGEAARQLAAALQKPLYIRARGKDPRAYELALLEPGEVEERVGLFSAGQELLCHRLGEEGEAAVSEEGYLVELQPPQKSPEESFTVELLRADSYRGVGRSLSAAGEAAEKPARPSGIRRRAFRQSRRKKEVAPLPTADGQKVPLLPIRPPLPPLPAAETPPPPAAVEPGPLHPPQAGHEPREAGPAPRRRRRRHHKKRPESPPGETATPVGTPPETTQEAPAAERPAAAAESSPAGPRRRPRRRYYRPRQRREPPPADKPG